MPTYDFSCPTCQLQFESFSTMKDYNGKATCPTCNKETDERVFTEPLSSSVVLADSEIKTLGHLAERNASKMSEDQKSELTRKYNDYKNKNRKELPRGMRYMK